MNEFGVQRNTRITSLAHSNKLIHDLILNVADQEPISQNPQLTKGSKLCIASFLMLYNSLQIHEWLINLPGMHTEFDSLAVHPLHKVSKSRFAFEFQFVFLCLAFDGIAIESGFKDGRVETCYFLMY
jgi:hypothetical protein